MIYLKLLKTFLLALPELVKLVEAIHKAQNDAATAAQVKKDLGKISDAFKNKDASALHDIFNS